MKIYKGDLKYGVRETRFKAKEKNWPRKVSNFFVQKCDRNTFIAGTILKSMKTDIKHQETKSYIELTKKNSIM